MFWIQLPFVGLRQVTSLLDVLLFNVLIAHVTFKIMQTIEMVISLFENNLPMRFGVILYSANIIQKIEANGDELQRSLEDDLKSEEDVSSLVMASILF